MLERDAIREAVWRAVTETGTHQEVARALKRRFGWRLSDRAAVARLSMMLSPRDPHQFPTRLLLSRVPRTRAATLTAAGLRERFAERVLRTEIPERAVVVEASARRSPVVTHAPASAAAAAFRALAEEVEA